MEPLRRRYVDWLFEWLSRIVVAYSAASLLYGIVVYGGLSISLATAGGSFVVYHLLGLAPDPYRTGARFLCFAVGFALNWLLLRPWPAVGSAGTFLTMWVLMSVIYGVLLIPRLDDWRDQAVINATAAFDN